MWSSSSSSSSSMSPPLLLPPPPPTSSTTPLAVLCHRKAAASQASEVIFQSFSQPRSNLRSGNENHHPSSPASLTPASPSPAPLPSSRTSRTVTPTHLHHLFPLTTSSSAPSASLGVDSHPRHPSSLFASPHQLPHQHSHQQCPQQSSDDDDPYRTYLPSPLQAPSVNMVHRLAHSQLNGKRFSKTHISNMPKAFTLAVSNQLNELPELISKLSKAVAAQDSIATRAYLAALGSFVFDHKLPALLSQAPSAMVISDSTQTSFSAHRYASPSSLATPPSSDTLTNSISLPNFPVEERRFHFHLSQQQAVCLLGGIPILVQSVLQDYSPTVTSGMFSPVTVQRTINTALSLLRQLAITSHEALRKLSDDRELIAHLFVLCNCKITCVNAVSLLEELLANRVKTWELCEVPVFNALVESLSFDDFVHFVKIFVMVVYDMEEHGVSDAVRISIDEQVRVHLRYNQALQPVNAVDRNHAIMLAHPLLLPRLVKVLEAGVQTTLKLNARRLSKEDNAPIPPQDQQQQQQRANNNRQPAHAFQDTMLASGAAGVATFEDQIMYSATFMDTEGDSSLYFLSDGDFASAAESVWPNNLHERLHDWYRLSSFHPSAQLMAAVAQGAHHQSSRNAQAKLISPCSLAEVMFTLNYLLASKRKAEVQTKLAGMGLVPILCSMFSLLDWAPTERSRNDMVGDTTFVKIQYLRLIHNMADSVVGTNTHRLFFSMSELAQIRKLEKQMGLCTRENYARDVYCQDSQGLLSYLIKEISTNDALDDNLKCLFVTSIESIVRGATPAERYVVVSDDLIKFLVNQILSPTFKTSNTYQCLFDLLGEVVRFCPSLLARLNAILTYSSFEQLIQAVFLHLVDANVFLRGVFLTLTTHSDLFADARQAGALALPINASYDAYACKFARFFSERENCLRLTLELMSIVTLEEMSQENICCLNSAIVFFIAAAHKGELALFIQELKRFNARVNQSSTEPFKNFNNLLRFWEEHYRRRYRDLFQLSSGSKIPIAAWHSIVAALLGPSQSPTSLRACE